MSLQGPNAKQASYSSGNQHAYVDKSHLKCIVSIKEQVSTTDATIDTSQGHEEAEGEEVTVVEVAHAVI